MDRILAYEDEASLSMHRVLRSSLIYPEQLQWMGNAGCMVSPHTDRLRTCHNQYMT